MKDLTKEYRARFIQEQLSGKLTMSGLLKAPKQVQYFEDMQDLENNCCCFDGIKQLGEQLIHSIRINGNRVTKGLSGDYLVSWGCYK